MLKIQENITKDHYWFPLTKCFNESVHRYQRNYRNLDTSFDNFIRYSVAFKIKSKESLEIIDVVFWFLSAYFEPSALLIFF